MTRPLAALLTASCAGCSFKCAQRKHEVEEAKEPYDEIFARMQAQFGAPQERRAPLSDDRDDALPACLEKGAKPRGARWFWSEGNIALAPVWLERHALIEERHARETSVPP